MPLSSFIPLGVLLIIAGVILHFATSHKKLAKIFIGIGATIALLTFVVIVVAVNSM